MYNCKMQTLTVELKERSYPIHIGAGLLSRGDFWPRIFLTSVP